MRVLFYFSMMVLLLSACGGGGGGSSDGDDNNPDPVVYNCDGSGSVTINGTATFDRVPVKGRLDTSAYLDYNDISVLPIRMAKVEAICPDGSLAYATEYSNEFGQYTLDVPENVDVVVRVQAVMNDASAPGWDVEVRDDTDGKKIWAMSGDEFESGSSDLTVDLHAASGWTGISYGNDRTAGPFAILDTVLDAMSVIRAVDPAAHFPPLDVYWSNDTQGTYYSNGEIYVLGAANLDTDEYDETVVAHEWGHYFEDKFSRSDSIGGQHSGGDKLDMRVAFGEGFGNAWSGIATDETVYRDTNDKSQGSGFSLGLENAADSSCVGCADSGWFNESAIQRILFDLYDSNNDLADDDKISLGFGPLYQVLTTTQKQSPYMTSLFPLITGLIADDAANEAAIDDLLAAAVIAPVNNEQGSGRTNYGGLAETQVSPIYTALVVDGSTVNVCVTKNGRTEPDDGPVSEYNKLGARRFLNFLVDVSGDHQIQVDGYAGSDPDFVVYNKGSVLRVSQAEGQSETSTVALTQQDEDYVLEVYDYWNTDDDASTGDSGCVDVTITGP